MNLRTSNAPPGANILVLGASENTFRFSNIATHMLQEYGYIPVLFGKSGHSVAGYAIHKHLDEIADTNIHTITLYLNPDHQKPFYQFIIQKKPRRLIFNPGTENSELKHLAENAGIECLEACTLVMLRTHQF